MRCMIGLTLCLAGEVYMDDYGGACAVSSAFRIYYNPGPASGAPFCV